MRGKKPPLVLIGAAAVLAIIVIVLSFAVCGRGGKDGATGESTGCAASRLTAELVDEKSALMKSLHDLADKDPNAPKIGVYPQLDQWKDAAGTQHTDYRLAGSDRAIIDKYIAARAKADPKLAPAADHALRYEKTFASGKTYWRTHYVVAQPVFDG